jgi:hypothetical protein
MPSPYLAPKHEGLVVHTPRNAEHDGKRELPKYGGFGLGPDECRASAAGAGT